MTAFLNQKFANARRHELACLTLAAELQMSKVLSCSVCGSELKRQGGHVVYVEMS